jgi:hypothetical protein
VPQAERGNPAARVERRAKRDAQDQGALVDQRPSHDEERKPEAKRRQHRAAVLQGEAGGDRHRGNECRGGESLRGAEKIAAFPSEQRSERHGQQQRNE